MLVLTQIYWYYIGWVAYPVFQPLSWDQFWPLKMRVLPHYHQISRGRKFDRSGAVPDCMINPAPSTMKFCTDFEQKLQILSALMAHANTVTQIVQIVLVNWRAVRSCYELNIFFNSFALYYFTIAEHNYLCKMSWIYRLYVHHVKVKYFDVKHK